MTPVSSQRIHAMRRPLLPQRTLPDLLFAAVVLLLAGCLTFQVLAIARLSLAQWMHPVLFGDSWGFTEPGNLPGWLFQQHNEHRIVFFRLVSFLETDLLGMPPLRTALIQTLLLLLLSSGIIAWIAALVLGRRSSRLLAWLACSVILTNPWQWENLAWEFQTPWFFVNSLVLGATLLLLGWGRARNPGHRLRFELGLAVVPLVAIYSTGQGLALAAALLLACWFLSRRLFLLVLVPSAAAAIVYFRVLPYAKPPTHPLGFDPDYLFSLLAGGSWPGLGVLWLLLLTHFLGETARFSEKRWILDARVVPSLAMPASYACLFALMTTLSRSGFGVGQAQSSRYVTPMLMLGISAVLLAARILDGQVRAGGRQAARRLLALAPASLVLLTTLFSFPQVLTGRGLVYRQAWGAANLRRHKEEAFFRCAARKAIAMRSSSDRSIACISEDPEKRLPPIYFSDRLPRRPVGWHRQLIESGRTASP
jgi:hypothetical protein